MPLRHSYSHASFSLSLSTLFLYFISFVIRFWRDGFSICYINPVFSLFPIVRDMPVSSQLVHSFPSVCCTVVCVSFFIFLSLFCATKRRERDMVTNLNGLSFFFVPGFCLSVLFCGGGDWCVFIPFHLICTFLRPSLRLLAAENLCLPKLDGETSHPRIVFVSPSKLEMISCGFHAINSLSQGNL